jgi:hypothetical protein
MYSKSDIFLQGRGLGMTVLTVSWVFILTSVFMCAANEQACALQSAVKDCDICTFF